MTFANAKQRFSNRVEDYVRYRPSYSAEVISYLAKNCGLHAGHIIADIGSGTGLLSKLFLENANHVYGVEPNAEMQAAGEEFLHSYPGFASITGSAEATTLADQSIDFVTAGQAFHWFDQVRTRKEFSRILKSGGWVVVVSNERQTDTSPFLRDYEALLRRFGTDYARVSDSYPRLEDMRAFFGTDAFLSHDLPNAQDFDFEGLRGRLRSSSYAPTPDQSGFPQMMNELKHIFTAYQKDDVVRFEYRTRIFAGNLVPTGISS
jgi:ubiquinone/menaquinone biosynthesis C-methylase UbiE